MDNLFDNDELEYEENSDLTRIDEEIQQQDAWDVINKYFDSKGLVGQQLDSFDEFIKNTIQETIDDNGEISVTSENQYRGDDSPDVSHLQYLIF